MSQTTKMAEKKLFGLSLTMDYWKKEDAPR